MTTADEVIGKIEADLAYRTPNLDKPLGHIVLTREQAEALVAAYHAPFVCDLELTPDEIERLKKAWDAQFR